MMSSPGWVETKSQKLGGPFLSRDSGIQVGRTYLDGARIDWSIAGRQEVGVDSEFASGFGRGGQEDFLPRGRRQWEET